jgi:1-acyl-sn-glycerol-3-phosphate acyltransferase
MTLAELRRYAPDSPDAWDARIGDIGTAARHLAFAARVPDAPATVIDHWNALTSLDRSRWFARAWELVTGLRGTKQ